MKAEINRQISEQLDTAKRNLMEALRIAHSDPYPSKHLLRALVKMAGECDYQQERLTPEGTI